jgi:hypothetical protein
VPRNVTVKDFPHQACPTPTFPTYNFFASSTSSNDGERCGKSHPSHGLRKESSRGVYTTAKSSALQFFFYIIMTIFKTESFERLLKAIQEVSARAFGLHHDAKNTSVPVTSIRNSRLM